MATAAARATLTVCMIVRDEERRLPGALASVAGLADEIVVVDSGSSDATREIATAAGARVIESPWLGFARQRNVALDAARGEWVLELDADERVGPALAQQLDAFLAEPPSDTVHLGVLPMRHRFLGRRLGPAGRYPFYRRRLIRRGSYRHDEARAVHEGLSVRERPWVFTADLEHELAGSLSEALRDTWAYAQLSAAAIGPVSDRDLLLGVLIRPPLKLAFGAVALGGMRDGALGLLRLALECGADAATWTLARHRNGRGPAAIPGHFSRRPQADRPSHILAIGDPRPHWGWLEEAADAGALVSVVAGAGQASPRLGGGECLRVRTADRRGPLSLLRAADAEAQISPITRGIALDRVGSLVLRLVPGGVGEIAAAAALTPAEAARESGTAGS